MQAKHVWLVRSHRCGVGVTIVARVGEPGKVGSRRLAELVVGVGIQARCGNPEAIFDGAPIPRGNGATPGGILPLRFRKQAIALSGFFGQPRHIGFCCGEVDVDHRSIAASPIFVIDVFATTVGSAGIPLRKRDFEFSDGERLGDGDRMRGLLIGERALFAIRPHHELALGQNDHRRACVAVLDFVKGLARRDAQQRGCKGQSDTHRHVCIFPMLIRFELCVNH